jgi:Flp pilus assembly protein TadD
LGVAYKELKDCFRAIAEFDSALVYVKDSTRTLVEKADCLITLEQFDEASRALETALLIKPTDARPYALKGMILEKRGFLTRAQDEYSRALYYDPHSITALRMRYQVLLKNGRPREALEDVNALARLERHQPEIFLTRARIHVKLKEFDKAAADFNTAEQLGGPNDQITKEKVQVYFMTGRPHMALDALTEHLKKQPHDPEALVLKALSHIQLNELPAAERILADVLAKHPDQAGAYLYGGVAAARRGDRDGALEYLNRAVELDPTLTAAYKERARVFMELKDNLRAAVDLTAAADLDPSDGEIPALRGVTNVARVLHDAAVADFTRALECLPGDPGILYDRAVAHWKRDDMDSALADLDAVLAKKPDAPRALSLRGAIRMSRGDFNRARSDFDRAAALRSNDPAVWNNRGYFLFRTGNYRAALSDLEKALTLDPEYRNAQFNRDLVVKKLDALGAAIGPGSTGVSTSVEEESEQP